MNTSYAGMTETIFIIVLIFVIAHIINLIKGDNKNSNDNKLISSLEEISRLKKTKEERVKILQEISSLLQDCDIDWLEEKHSFKYPDIYKTIESEIKDLDFSGVVVENFLVQDLSLIGINFSNTVMENARIFRSSLIDVDFSNSKLKNILFTKSNIRSSDFSGADLRHAWLENISFSNSYFIDANLSEANLKGVDLSEAILKPSQLNVMDQVEYFGDDLNKIRVSFYKAIYDSKTIFPEGFNPNAFNMIKYEDKVDINEWIKKK